MKKQNAEIAVVLGVIIVLAMMAVEQLLKPDYLIKSALKLLLFGGGIFLYAFLSREKISEVLHITGKRPSRKLVVILIGTYVFLMAGFFLLRGELDLPRIKDALTAKEHLTRENFWIVFLYIIVVNSFLEEAFFRGFLYHALRPFGTLPAYLAGSFLFAVYHIGIVSGWFGPLMMILCILGLMGAGLFLQYIEEKNDTLLASWMVHAFANLAINTVGTIVILSLM